MLSYLRERQARTLVWAIPDFSAPRVMLAVILVLVVGTIRLVGSNANNVFSQVGVPLISRRMAQTPHAWAPPIPSNTERVLDGALGRYAAQLGWTVGLFTP